MHTVQRRICCEHQPIATDSNASNGLEFAIAIAFALFRFFDIVKPPPIRQLDAAMKNGLGVMLDDMLAALYALVVFAIGQRVIG